MIIREPFVHVTYYYLREAPGDNPARRADHHAAFAADAERTLHALAGWLALPTPPLTPVPLWEAASPLHIQPLGQTSVLEGQSNAGAMMGTYVLRNMLLLRVVVGRHGEHDDTVWPILDEALPVTPTTPAWLDTVRYWCGVAPRPPENLEQERLQPVKTPFGVLCQGNGSASAHLLIYPDARTESRANIYLKTLAAELDWFRVQANHRADMYDDHASRVARNQQTALEQVLHSDAIWQAPAASPAPALNSLAPLQDELDALQTAYGEVMVDLSATRAAAHDMHTLHADYRRTLMQHGLWDAAPTVWEAQAALLAAHQARIEADVQYIDNTLRRVEVTLRNVQTRVALVQAERARLLIYATGGTGAALLVVLILDANPLLILVRLIVLALLFGGGWYAWRRGWIGDRRAINDPATDEKDHQWP